MVKIIKFLCIAGIIALLILFISYTEAGLQETDKNLTKIDEQELLDTQFLKTKVEEEKNDESNFWFINVLQTADMNN